MSFEEVYKLTEEDYKIIISAMETVREVAMGFDVADIDRILSKLYFYRSSKETIPLGVE